MQTNVTTTKTSSKGPKGNRQVVTVIKTRPPAVRPPGQGQSRQARRRRAAKARGQFPKGSGSKLSNSNLYLSSLLDPLSVSGVKIPDMDCQLSGTLCAQYSTTLSTAAGDGITILACPQTPYEFINWGTNSAVGGALTFGSWQPCLGFSTLNSATQAVRVVSAVLEVEFIGSTSQDCGVVVAGQWAGVHDITPISNTAYNYYKDSPTFRTYPLRNGVRVLYRPVDNTDFEYSDTDHAQTSYNSYIGHYPQTLIVQITSATSNLAIAKVFFKANYEVLPSFGQVGLLDTKPSPSDSTSMDAALNTIGATVLTTVLAENIIPAFATGVGMAWQGYRGGIRPGTVGAFGH